MNNVNASHNYDIRSACQDFIVKNICNKTLIGICVFISFHFNMKPKVLNYYVPLRCKSNIIHRKRREDKNVLSYFPPLPTPEAEWLPWQPTSSLRDDSSSLSESLQLFCFNRFRHCPTSPSISCSICTTVRAIIQKQNSDHITSKASNTVRMLSRKKIETSYEQSIQNLYFLALAHFFCHPVSPFPIIQSDMSMTGCFPEVNCPSEIACRLLRAPSRKLLHSVLGSSKSPVISLSIFFFSLSVAWAL